MHRAVFKCIALQHNPLSLPADTNTDILIFACCIFKSCVVNGNLLSLSLNIDANPLLFRTVVANDTILDPVPAAASKFVCLITKQYSNLTVTFDHALFYKVVCITVADTDSVSTVLRQNAVFRKAVRNTPAKENPLAISP